MDDARVIKIAFRLAREFPDNDPDWCVESARLIVEWSENEARLMETFGQELLRIAALPEFDPWDNDQWSRAA